MASGTTTDTESLIDARLRLLATQTRVGVIPVLQGIPPTYMETLQDYILVSVVDGFAYALPKLHPRFGFPIFGDCIFLNGKVYTFGGETCDGSLVDEVYVMDVAGPRQWKQCKSMPYASCCEEEVTPLNGKIYVEGYAFNPDDDYVRNDVVQVYDPSSDTWDVIQKAPGATGFDVVPGLSGAWNVLQGVRMLSSCRLDNFDVIPEPRVEL